MDLKWGDKRLEELVARRERLAATAEQVCEPLKVYIDTAFPYQCQLDRVLTNGNRVERKKPLPTWV